MTESLTFHIDKFTFKVPTDRYYTEEGVLKSKVFGEVAIMRPNDMVDIKEFKIERYDSDENVEMTITAPDCTFNKKTKSAQSPDKVRIAAEKMIVTGKDFTWDSGTERFIIREDAKVVLMDVRKNMNKKPEGAGDDS